MDRSRSAYCPVCRQGIASEWNFARFVGNLEISLALGGSWSRNRITNVVVDKMLNVLPREPPNDPSDSAICGGVAGRGPFSASLSICPDGCVASAAAVSEGRTDSAGG